MRRSNAMSLTQKQKIKILKLEDVILKLKTKEAGILRSFKNLEYDFETVIRKNKNLADDNVKMANYIILLQTKGNVKKLYEEKVKNGTTKA